MLYRLVCSFMGAVIGFQPTVLSTVALIMLQCCVRPSSSSVMYCG